MAVNIFHENAFYGYSAEDVLSSEMEIQTLDYISCLLKTQFNVRYGCLTPSYLYGVTSSDVQLQPRERVPPGVKAVQIHWINGHYVVSCQDMGEVTLYDSLMSGNRIGEVMPQLRKMYEVVENGCNIEYHVAQTQGLSSLCGAFATANALLLLCDQVPGRQLLKTDMMLEHLYQCLLNGFLDCFPEYSAGEIGYGCERFYSNRNDYVGDEKKERQRCLYSEVVKKSYCSEDHSAEQMDYGSDRFYAKINDYIGDQQKKQRQRCLYSEVLKKSNASATGESVKSDKTKTVTTELSQKRKAFESGKKVTGQKRMSSKERKQKQRARQTSTERDVQRQKNKEKMKQYRDSLTAEARMEVRKKARTSMEKVRQCMTSEEKEEKRNLHRQSMQNMRVRKTADENRKEREQHRERRR